MKYKGKEINDLFALQFMAKSKDERLTIMENMTEKQLNTLAQVIMVATTNVIKDMPLVIRDK